MKALDGLTLQEVNDLARSGLYDFGKLTVVMVGDKGAVLPQLKEAGFPEPVLVDAEGRPSKEAAGGR
jgi:hypothetical protein